LPNETLTSCHAVPTSSYAVVEWIDFLQTRLDAQRLLRPTDGLEGVQSRN